MKILTREATPVTPMIKFNPENGLMEIQGRSIPNDSDDYWMPILSWFEGYMNHPQDETIFKVNLDYFNISSSKRILFLLYKLNELIDAGKKVRVIWEYRTEDEDMFEVGQDYAYMVKVPFEFVEIKESILVPV